MARPLLPILLLLCSTANPALGHITEDTMPDAVAQMEYRILLEFEPENITARNKLGMIYVRLDKLSQAEAEFNRVLAQDPQNFNAIDALGLIRLKEKKLQAALQLFQQAKVLLPSDPLVHHHLGITLERRGNLPAAVDAYRTALRLNNARQDSPAKQTANQQIRPALDAAERKLAPRGLPAKQ